MTQWHRISLQCTKFWVKTPIPLYQCINVCGIHTDILYIYIYLHTYIFVCVCVCICLKKKIHGTVHAYTYTYVKALVMIFKIRYFWKCIYFWSSIWLQVFKVFDIFSQSVRQIDYLYMPLSFIISPCGTYCYIVNLQKISPNLQFTDLFIIPHWFVNSKHEDILLELLTVLFRSSHWKKILPTVSIRSKPKQFFCIFLFLRLFFSIQVILTPVLRDRVIHFNNFLAQIYFQLFIFNFLLDILDNIFYNGNIAEKLFPSTAIQVSHISDYGWLCLLLFYEPWISLDAFNFLPLVMHVFFLLIYFRWMMSLKSHYLSLVTWFSFVVFIFLIWTTTGL